MKKQFLVIGAIYIILFLLWLITKDGIHPELLIQKKDNKISIYFDSYLLGSAIDTSQESRNLNISFKYQDLHSPYFMGKSSVEHSKFTLSSNNYTFQTELYNPFAVRLTFQGAKSFVFFFNPYRHLNSGWEDPQTILTNTQQYQVRISAINGLLWCIWLVLQPFPYVSLILFPILLLFMKQKNASTHTRQYTDASKNYFIWGIPLGIASISYHWSRYLMKNYLQDAPHVPDAISYILSAKILASGKLTVPFTDIPRFVPTSMYKDYFYHWFTIKDNFMYIFYPLGHPLILSLGERFHHIHLIPPIVGSIVLLLIFYIVYKCTHSMAYSSFAMLLCLFSPFFQTQTIDYMSHNTASLFLLLSLVPLLQSDNKYLLFTGLFQGMLLNTRPLTTIVTFPLVCLYILFQLEHKFNFKKYILSAFKKYVYVAIGFIFPLSMFFYFNYLTSGNIFLSSYSSTGILNKVALGSNFKIGYGLLHGFSNLAVFSLFFLKNYNISFFPFILSMVLIPFSGKLTRLIIFLQFLAVSIVAVWFLYDGNFFMYGPRFIYEAVPILVILYGLTFYILFQTIMSFDFTNTYQIAGKAFIAIIMGLYICQIILFELSWLNLRKQEYTDIFFVPSSIADLRSFNYADGRIKRYAETNKDKIILMKKCDNWWCTGEGIWLNTFPLTQSEQIFLTMPDKYKGHIQGAKVIDWNKL